MKVLIKIALCLVLLTGAAGAADVEKLAKETTVNALVANGFSKDKIVIALPSEAGNVDDYMAMLWMPPNPDHIKIQKITKVDPADAEGMVGVWKGVSKDDIFEIKI